MVVAARGQVDGETAKPLTNSPMDQWVDTRRAQLTTDDHDSDRG